MKSRSPGHLGSALVPEQGDLRDRMWLCILLARTFVKFLFHPILQLLLLPWHITPGRFPEGRHREAGQV